MDSLEEFLKISPSNKDANIKTFVRQPLTTKTAIELLLNGELKIRVCKFCLYIDDNLYELDQIFEIMGNKMPYKLSVKDMIGSIYPFQVSFVMFFII